MASPRDVGPELLRDGECGFRRSLLGETEQVSQPQGAAEGSAAGVSARDAHVPSMPPGFSEMCPHLLEVAAKISEVVG